MTGICMELGITWKFPGHPPILIGRVLICTKETAVCCSVTVAVRRNYMDGAKLCSGHCTTAVFLYCNTLHCTQCSDFALGNTLAVSGAVQLSADTARREVLRTKVQCTDPTMAGLRQIELKANSGKSLKNELRRSYLRGWCLQTRGLANERGGSEYYVRKM